MKYIGCVPNFSEGKNEDTFELMKESLTGIPNVKILRMEPDAKYNRIIITLVGDENGIFQSAVALSVTAASEIDMRRHKGIHPRIGAIDVVPFVPIKNVSMAECVTLSEVFAERISTELDLPVYLYEKSARKPLRQNITNIRSGGYEGLEAKLQDPEWYPDYGKNQFNPKLGALITGARCFLISYNVNLKVQDIAYAKEIAEVLRESGKPKRDSSGSIIKVDGVVLREPGRLKCVNAIGTSLDQNRLTSVALNLTNFSVTGLHTVYEEVKKEADRLGIEVCGSTINGVIPLDALLDAGRYYSRNTVSDEESLLKIAIEKLALEHLNPFIANERIIDYMI
jgi:glutamate formiminotransferase/formiminotetrahydrofolate cyclodeaminase